VSFLYYKNSHQINMMYHLFFLPGHHLFQFPVLVINLNAAERVVLVATVYKKLFFCGIRIRTKKPMTAIIITKMSIFFFI